MQTSKSSAIDEILSRAGDDDGFEYEAPTSRKPAAKPLKAPARNTQAWRSIEDRLEARKLERKLKEIYEED